MKSKKESITTNENGIFKKLGRITKLHVLAFICVCLIGMLLIVVSYRFPAKGDDGLENFWRLFFRDIGITLFPIGIMSFVYEFILRGNFLDTMHSKIEELMPGRYSNLRKAGIVDSYAKLNIDRLGEELDVVTDCEIRILDIWMENFNRIEKTIKEAVIDRRCSVKILVWDPTETNALDGRGKTLGNMAIADIQKMIMINLRWIRNILIALNDEERQRFQVKLYASFISISMIGYGSEFQIGFYLRGRVSSIGSQVKVAGEQHFLFRELKKHFDDEWNSDESRVFDENLYNELIRD